MLDTSLSDNFLENVIVFTRSYTASHSPVDDNLEDYSNASDSIMKVNELQKLDDLAVPLPTLKLFEEQR